MNISPGMFPIVIREIKLGFPGSHGSTVVAPKVNISGSTQEDMCHKSLNYHGNTILDVNISFEG